MYSLHIYTLTIVDVCVVVSSILLLGNNLLLKREEVISRDIQKNQTRNFPVISNQRSSDDIHINPQYYTKQPTLYGYSPIINPPATSGVNNTEYPAIMKYLFYPTDTTSHPKINGNFDIHSIRLTPNSAEAIITIQSDQENIVWSSPYSPFWKLVVDDIPSNTQPNVYRTNSI